MSNTRINKNIWLKAGITVVYFLLFFLYFSSIDIPYKGVYPLSFLTLCALFFSSPMMAAALFFSALGDYMGICHNFWGQMTSFALAHIAYICFFGVKLREEGRLNFQSVAGRWKAVLLTVLFMVIYLLIGKNVDPLPLQAGVTIYSALILTMCWSAWQQSNRWFTLGAWLFLFSDCMLAWNKFNEPVENIRYWIMVPYLTGQWMLFLPTVRKWMKKND